MNNCAIIGAGKFAFSFTTALKKAGVNVTCIISRSLSSAAELATIADVKLYSDKLSDLPSDVQMVFITVPDSEIRNIADNLSTLKNEFTGRTFIHCSGALDSSELQPLEDKGAASASFHVMQTFPSKKIVEIKGCYASIETNDEVCYNELNDLAIRLQLNPFRLMKEEKTAYHLAGIFASNFLIGNMFSASKIFPGDVSRFDILEPIIQSTMNNIRQNGIAQALSGPIDRGDIETIQKHIKEIKDKELLRSYISQSLILLQAAEEKYSLLTENQKKIKEYLNRL